MSSVKKPLSMFHFCLFAFARTFRLRGLLPEFSQPVSSELEVERSPTPSSILLDDAVLINQFAVYDARALTLTTFWKVSSSVSRARDTGPEQPAITAELISEAVDARNVEGHHVGRGCGEFSTVWKEPIAQADTYVPC